MVSTTEVIRDAAEASGGAVRRVSDGVPDIVPVRGQAESGSSRMGFRTTGDSVLKSVDRVPLFAGFLGLGVMLLALGSMWYREGR